MKVPYSQVHVHGPVIFAARSGWIESFNVQDGSHISSWKHPDSEIAEKVEDSNGDGAAEPPSKRQKTSEDEDVSTSKTTDVVQDENEPAVSAEKGKNSKADLIAPSRKGQLSRAPDRPVVIQLTSTVDGKYVIAVTGHDKAIWVFEHDGAGHLKQLSKRSALSPFLQACMGHLAKLPIGSCPNAQMLSASALAPRSSAATSLAMSTLSRSFLLTHQPV